MVSNEESPTECLPTFMRLKPAILHQYSGFTKVYPDTGIPVHVYTRIQNYHKMQIARSISHGAGDLLAGETGLEPATPGFGDRCSAS